VQQGSAFVCSSSPKEQQMKQIEPKAEETTENSSESNNPEGGSKDFMLAQYKALSDSFWRNEELGERRVNFLIALVTAVIAALVALADVKQVDFEDIVLPSIPAVTALLLLGIVTWCRMLRRNRVTDEYKRAMGIVSNWFEIDDPQLAAYRPFPDLVLFSLDYGKFAAELPGKRGAIDMSAPFKARFDPDNERLGAEPKTRVIEDDRRWLVYSKDKDSTRRIRRRRRYLMKRANDKLVVYRPRKPSWGGLAEMVGVMNSVFVGVLLVLLVLGLARITCKGEDFTVGGALLGSALIVGLLGVVGAIVVQYLWMVRFYEQYDIRVPKGDSPSHDNNIPSTTGK
jgi:hypothetical protein